MSPKTYLSKHINCTLQFIKPVKAILYCIQLFIGLIISLMYILTLYLYIGRFFNASFKYQRHNELLHYGNLHRYCKVEFFMRNRLKSLFRLCPG